MITPASIYMEVALHLTVAGGINVTTSYWVENLNLSFSVQKHVWISMVPECLPEMDWKNFEKNEKNSRKIPAQEQHF